MSHLGMDDVLVEGVARQLSQQAAHLKGIIGQIDAAVQRATATWTGKDAEDFLALWSGQHRTALNQLQQAIELLSSEAMRSVREQRAISSY